MYDRLLRALDDASDIFVQGSTATTDGVDHIEGTSYEREAIAYLRAQTAALTAIAFLMLRQDDEALDAWNHY